MDKKTIKYAEDLVKWLEKRKNLCVGDDCDFSHGIIHGLDFAIDMIEKDIRVNN